MLCGNSAVPPNNQIASSTKFLERAFVWIEDANIHAAVPTTRERVDLWISANIHVPGRPEWIFVKVWGHSVESDAEVANNLAGGSFETALDWLESHYNDGRKYALHGVLRL